MRMSVVIERLRAGCPSFKGRVAGASEFKPLPETAKMAVPSAYVMPLDDDAGEQRSQTDYYQLVTDGFAVVVVIANTADERGQHAVDHVHDLRREIWRALLGWQPTPDYNPVTYEGGALVEMDRARLYYQFEFSASFEIGEEDTRQWDELEALPEFEGVCGHGDQWGIDYLDPGLGPNVVPPEWRIIEHQFSFPANTVFIDDYSNMLRLASAVNDASQLGFAPNKE